MNTLADRIEKIQTEMAMLEPVYVKAKERVSGEDPEWEHKKAQLIRQMTDLLSRFKIGDEPHKAVAIVAQASILANELRMPEHWVAQYEEKKVLLRMAQDEWDRGEEAKKRAEELSRNQTWRTRAAI
jgi:hypothetical protein